MNTSCVMKNICHDVFPIFIYTVLINNLTNDLSIHKLLFNFKNKIDFNNQIYFVIIVTTLTITVNLYPNFIMIFIKIFL